MSQCVQIYGYVFHDINGPNHGPTLKIQSIFLNEICTDTHLLVSCEKGQLEEVLMELGWEKVADWKCLFVHRNQWLFLSVYVDDKQWLEKKEEHGSHVEEIDEKC